MQEPAYPGTVFESATEFLKTPPFSIEAEQSVLGGLMLNNAAWISIADRLGATDFYRPEHKKIFNAIKSLCEEGHPCDVVTLSEWLERQTQLESIGGLAYLGLLARNTPSAANIVAYADIVREHSILRQLIKVGTEIANSGFNSQGRNSAELLDYAERQVFEIAEQQARNRGGFVQLKDILTQTLDQIDVLSRKEGLITGIASGFNDFDKMTSGLQRSDLIIVAGRPSHGKCLAKDAQIMLVDGRIFSIETLYQRQQAHLLTLDQHGCFQATQASAFIDDGMKPVFRVTTALGRMLKTTVTHPYLTPQGWQPLATLKVGTQIAVPRQLECFGHQTLPLWEIKLLSYLVGQDDLSTEPLQLTLTHPQLQDDMQSIDPSTVKRHRHSAMPQAVNTAAVATVPAISYTLKKVPQSWRALLTQLPEHRSLPEVILTLARPQLALFLNRLFAIKGYCRQHQLYYDGISEPLARQLQHLLVRFGIIATVQQSTQQYWQVMINQPSACQRFISEIGLFVHTVDLA
ncbi:MAG: DnaB-like helicase N-terminal domain-containing protein, partial [Pseudomonadota bacterium]|nr:DnaB-like helicase N-terminal domain-containing protein [Pseudomonadota bacterium]